MKQGRVARALVRGEPVVHGVLAATLEEVARVGYRALRIEDVAVRAGVNKTTVYRRWPTKAELVRAALSSATDEWLKHPHTGSLHTDLIEMGRCFVEVGCSTQGQSVMRMLLAEGFESEVVDLGKALRAEHEAVPKAVIASAIARGELAPDVDSMVLIEAFIGAVHHKLFVMNERVEEAFLSRLADMLLFGALHPSARGAKPCCGTCGRVV